MLINRQELAFFRSVVHGVEPRDAFDRYLLLLHDGGRCDERLAARALREIREVCAGLASKAGRTRDARLLRLQIMSVAPAIETKTPTLEQFAEENGLDGFSEREIESAWSERYGTGPEARKQRQRQKIIERQLRAIREIEILHTKGPEPADLVRLWFSPNLAQKLEAHNLHTLYSLAEHMHRPGWYRRIEGIGETKARRIEAFMAQCGLIQTEAQQPPPPATPDTLPGHAPAHPPAGTLVAQAWDTMGRAGTGGMGGAAQALAIALEGTARDTSALGVSDDAGALRAFLSAYTGHTARAYRKEIERLVIWCVFSPQKPISQLTREDVMEYGAFIRDPQPRSTWCAPRNIPKSSAAWRPFEGPLSESSARVAMAVVGKLFSFLASSGYMAANPAVHLPKSRTPSLRQQFGRRTLNDDQLEALRAQADPKTRRGERLGLLMDLLFSCGLRISEAAAACFDDVQDIGDGFLLHVVGKGQKFREVPIPEEVVATSRKLALERGCAAAELHRAHLIGPVGSAFGGAAEDPYAPVHEAVLSREIRDAARSAATQAKIAGKDEVARRLERASAHWLRHTHASKAIEAGVDVVAVQANLGHASLATTSVYTSMEQRQRLAQMRGFWKRPPAGA